MKKYILDFLKEKKELILFLGVLLCLSGAILTINKFAVKKTTITTTNINNPTNTTNKDDDVNITIPEEKMILPILGDYNIVLEFFDLDNPTTMDMAVIVNGSSYIESNGLSYAKLDNTSFDVLAVLSGTVISVLPDSLEKTIITIEHDNNLYSRYYSVTDVKVKEKDKVKVGDVIGKASESLFNTSAGIHVHLEIINNNEYLNPKYCYDKTIGEIISQTGK
jgi:stage II sporulation protein Q